MSYQRVEFLTGTERRRFYTRDEKARLVDEAFRPGVMITSAARLGEDIDWLWDVCAEMEPEDGCLWVYGPDQDQTIAFTPFGLENLKDLIKHYKANPDTLHRSA